MLPVKNNFSRVILIAIVLSIALWGIAYQLAPDKSAFMKDHSFQYQIIWLPLHIFLGYFSILVYKKAAYAKHYKEISLSSILQDFKKNYRAVFFAVLLIIPFVVEDTLDGLVQLQTNFETLGNASWVMIGPIWTIEWLMLGVMWSRVIATIRLTVNVYTPKFIDEHLDDILILNPTSPYLQAGVENALINLIYAISTIVYIQYTGGENSDFQTTAISAALVLVSFLSSFFFLRMRVNQALERIVEKHARKVEGIYIKPDNEFTKGIFKNLGLNTLLIDNFVLHKPLKMSNRGLERLSIVRTSLLMDSIKEQGNAESLSVSTAIQSIRYSQYEQKLASLGILELQGVLIRLGSPMIMLIAKSGVLSQLH